MSNDDEKGEAPVLSGSLDLGELGEKRTAYWLNGDWTAENNQPFLKSKNGSPLWLQDNAVEKIITHVKTSKEEGEE